MQDGVPARQAFPAPQGLSRMERLQRSRCTSDRSASPCRTQKSRSGNPRRVHELRPRPSTRELDLAIGASSLGGCVDDVLFPALREIGCLWQSGELDLEAERLTSEAVRGWLEVLALSAPEPSDAAPLILACGPADQHSIGLEALDVLLRHQGQRCRVLGSRTSVRALTTAMNANRPRGVVIASHLAANRSSAAGALRAAAALGAEVFYAGRPLIPRDCDATSRELIWTRPFRARAPSSRAAEPASM